MPKLDREDLRRRLEFSERKRSLFQRRLKERSVEEDTLLWSMADLMTLLLVFFILFYSHVSNRPAAAQIPPAEERSVLKVERPSFWLNLTKAKRSIAPRITKSPEPAPLLEHETEGKRDEPSRILEKRVKLAAGGMRGVDQTENWATALPLIEEETHMKSQKKEKRMEMDEEGSKPGPAEKKEDGSQRASRAQRDEADALEREVMVALHDVEAGDFSVRRDRSRIVLVLGERITFHTGEAVLLDEYLPALERIAKFIAGKESYEILVSGHTDDTPIHTQRFPSNWELSAARALSVAKFLIANGVSPERISIQGFSKYRPLVENSSERNKRANRRVEIVLIRNQNA